MKSNEPNEWKFSLNIAAAAQSPNNRSRIISAYNIPWERNSPDGYELPRDCAVIITVHFFAVLYELNWFFIVVIDVARLFSLVPWNLFFFFRKIVHSLRYARCPLLRTDNSTRSKFINEAQIPENGSTVCRYVNIVCVCVCVVCT